MSEEGKKVNESEKAKWSFWMKVNEELLKDVDLAFKFKSTEYGKRIEKVIKKYNRDIDKWLNEPNN